MDNKKGFLKIALLTAVAALLVGVLFGMVTHPKVDNTVPYEQFLEYVNNDEVSKIQIGDSDKFTFYVGEGDEAKIFRSTNPDYDTFKKDMLEAGVDVEVEKKANLSWLTSLIMPIGIFSIFFLFMSKQMGNNENIGIQYDKSENKVTFDNVAGLSEVKSDLRDVTDFLSNPHKYTQSGAKLPKGVLLYGPPGTGKTLLAKAMAGEANANFIFLSGSDFSNKFIGVGGDRVRKLFQDARKQAPCIIFIDEIDAVGGNREGNMHSENRNTLNALLAEMDGFNTGDGIMVIAATNRLEDLDPALVRPGRFDNIFAVPLPSTTEERKEIIEVYKRGKKFDKSVDFNMLAKQMIGSSPAEIEAVMNEASILATKRNAGVVRKEDLDEAYLKKVLKGHVKENDERDEEQLRLVAYHEAGHALVGTMLGQEATKVTIQPSSSGAGGFTIFNPSKLGMYSKKELEERVMALYAGRVSEELLVGPANITTGASNDIERATAIVKSIVSQYGMCSGDNAPTILDYSQVDGSEKFIMEAMNELARSLYKRTKDLLEENRNKLDKMASELLDKETLSGDEIMAIVKG